MSATAAGTKATIVDAARRTLLADGHASLSTRKVAEAASVPLSQLHYHFGSKQRLLLAVLEEEDRRRLARQTRMYATERPLWQRYEQACDFLEDDLDSGYVRVLQEMIAAGWGDDEIGAHVRRLLGGWVDLLTEVTREAEQRHGPLGPFTAEELSALIATMFIGAEALILTGFDRQVMPIRQALRRIGTLIRAMEERSGKGAEGAGALA